MTWLALALISAVMLTLVNYSDKFIMESRLPDARAFLVYVALVDGATGVLLWFLAGAEFLPFTQGLLLLLAGTTIVLANLFYFQAIAVEETSRVIVWIQLTPIPTLIISLLFFGEVLSVQQLIGFTLVLLSAILIARGKGNWRNIFRLSPAFWLVVVATIMWALENIIVDQALSFSQADTIGSLALLARIASYTSIGHTLGVAVLFTVSAKVRKSFFTYWQQRSVRQIMPILGLQAMFVSRQFVLYTALALGPVALVTVIGSTQVLWGVLMGWGLTLIMPSIFKEDITRDVLIEKAILSVIMFIGIVLIN